MKIEFWGVRGTRPVPGERTVEYGGNTPCVEISVGDNLLIMDAGTGIVNLGDKMLEDKILKASLFISHTHWDHIQGLPMFRPLYQKDFTFDIYGPQTIDKPLGEILSNQMTHEYYPVSWENLPCKKRIQQLKALESINIGGTFKITPFKAQHTCLCLNYKIEHEGKVCIYATDNEWEMGGKDELEQTIRNCDLLILDTSFTDEEYYGIGGKDSKVGWGHGSWQKGVEMARLCKVKQTVLFHHGVDRFDDELNSIEEAAKAIYSRVSVAKEGMVIDL